MTAPELVIMAGHVCEAVAGCTCGAPGGPYPHEAHCGLEPIGTVEQVLADLQLVNRARQSRKGEPPTDTTSLGVTTLAARLAEAELEVRVLHLSLDDTARRLEAALAQVERQQRYLATTGRAPMPDLSGPVAGQTALEVRPDGSLAGLR